jgi:hypothetical protein
MDSIREVAVRLARTPFLRLTKAGILRVVRRKQWPKDGLNQKGRVQAVYDLAREIMRQRSRRFFTRYVRPVPPLTERLRSWRERRARAAAREREGPVQFWVAAGHARFREVRGRRGEHHVQVQVVQDVVEVGASGDAYRIKRRRRSSEHHFHIPADWVARVHEAELGLHDRRLTLWVERQDDVLRGKNRVEVFSAVWCHQGRGYSLLTERGFIARLGLHVAHAESPAAAVRRVVQRTTVNTRRIGPNS